MSVSRRSGEGLAPQRRPPPCDPLLTSIPLPTNRVTLEDGSGDVVIVPSARSRSRVSESNHDDSSALQIWRPWRASSAYLKAEPLGSLRQASQPSTMLLLGQPVEAAGWSRRVRCNVREHADDVPFADDAPPAAMTPVGVHRPAKDVVAEEVVAVSPSSPGAVMVEVEETTPPQPSAPSLKWRDGRRSYDTPSFAVPKAADGNGSRVQQGECLGVIDLTRPRNVAGTHILPGVKGPNVVAPVRVALTSRSPPRPKVVLPGESRRLESSSVAAASKLQSHPNARPMVAERDAAVLAAMKDAEDEIRQLLLRPSQWSSSMPPPFQPYPPTGGGYDEMRMGRRDDARRSPEASRHADLGRGPPRSDDARDRRGPSTTGAAPQDVHSPPVAALNSPSARPFSSPNELRRSPAGRVLGTSASLPSVSDLTSPAIQPRRSAVAPPGGRTSHHRGGGGQVVVNHHSDTSSSRLSNPQPSVLSRRSPPPGSGDVHHQIPSSSGLATANTTVRTELRVSLSKPDDDQPTQRYSGGRWSPPRAEANRGGASAVRFVSPSRAALLADFPSVDDPSRLSREGARAVAALKQQQRGHHESAAAYPHRPPPPRRSTGLGALINGAADDYKEGHSTRHASEVPQRRSTSPSRSRGGAVMAVPGSESSHQLYHARATVHTSARASNQQSTGGRDGHQHDGAAPQPSASRQTAPPSARPPISPELARFLVIVGGGGTAQAKILLRRLMSCDRNFTGVVAWVDVRRELCNVYGDAAGRVSDGELMEVVAAPTERVTGASGPRSAAPVISYATLVSQLSDVAGLWSPSSGTAASSGRRSPPRSPFLRGSDPWL